MKKIIPILVSLLFVGSTFGIASIVSESSTSPCSSCDGEFPCLCDGSPYGISMTTVRIGQTYTITHNKQVSYWQWIKVDDFARSAMWDEIVANGFPLRLGLVELIDFRAYYLGDASSYDYKEAFEKGSDGLDHTVYTFRAVRPGTVYFTFKCNPAGVGPCSCCDRVVPVRILPSLPMDWIMKILGLGKTD